MWGAGVLRARRTGDAVSLYVERIERELGIAEPGKTRVEFQFFNFGRRIGVIIQWPDERHAFMMQFIPTWCDDLIHAAQEWRGRRDAL